MDIRTVRARPPVGSGPIYRYGMLVFILVLLAQQIQWHVTLPPTYDGDPYDNYVLILMLLFNHLAFTFKWPRHLSVGLWVLAWSWLGFTCFYCLYFSRVLYPLE